MLLRLQRGRGGGSNVDISYFLPSNVWRFQYFFVYLWREISFNYSFQWLMTTISLTYNEKNQLAKKTVDFLLSLGVFKVEAYDSNTRKKTLKAIKDAKEKRNVTVCDTFEDYLKAVSE